MACKHSDELPRSGFTIIELVVVITIIGLIAIIPLSRGLMATSYQPPVVANKLIFDIRYAQALSMSTASHCGISFNVAGNAYTLFVGSSATPLTDPVNQGPYTVQYGSGAYSAINLTSANFGGSPTLSFDSRGRPLDGTGTFLAADGTVVLNSSMNVTVTRETGYAKVN
ncbi:MAG: GspH/FimT family protein [Chlamydiota bacterium]|nr:GspH/FimT family protein [Chlamydiota bacterium]